MTLEQTLAAALGAGYRLERELGGGGMSRVFLAEEVALGRRVVVKVLPPEMELALSGERFAREVQLAAQLQHPTIVPVLSAGTGHGLAWYTMPFVEGDSLRQRLASGTPLPLPSALRWGRDLFEALAAAHAKGIVHRDIKPENLLLTGDRASLADFGIARAVQASTNAERLTGTGIALGTPAYMAPEQAIGDPAADHRVDLYAAGLVLYEMLAGRGPFDGRNPSQFAAAHLTQLPPPLRRFRPDVPPALEAIVMRCLAKDPGERPTSALEVRDVLEGILVQATAAPAAAARPGGRRRVAAVAGFVVVLAAVAAGVAWWRGNGETGKARDDAASRDLILLADVAAAPGDSTPARALGEALRIDLQASPKLRFPEAERIRRVRVTLQQDPRTPLPLDTALVVAQRLGAKAVVGATLERVGGGFALSARLVAVDGGRDVTALRETARDSSELLGAMDRLGRGLRERAGESLQSLAARTPLPLLTTRSFAALERAAAGNVLLAQYSNRAAADQFAQAIELDSTFAAAWYGYARALGALSVRADSQVVALSRAYALREHLTTAERARIEARWARLERRTSDAAGALRRALAEAPEDDDTRRDLSSVLLGIGRPAEARVLADSVLGRSPADMLARGIAMEAALLAGDTAAAGRYARENPLRGQPQWYRMRHQERLANRDWRRANAYADSAVAILHARDDRREPVALGGRVIGALVVGHFREAASLATRRRVLALRYRDSAMALESALSTVAARALVLGDRDGARRALDSALAQVPLGSLPPVSRPYEVAAVLAAIVGDAARAEALLAERDRVLPASLAPFVRQVDLHLARGWIAMARQQPGDALAQFTAAGREPESDACVVGCFESLRALAFEALAQSDSAEAAWRRFVEVRSVSRWGMDPLFLAHAYRWLAVRYAARGDTDAAIAMALALVELWETADPELQPVVAEMRALVAKLEARRG